MNSFIGKRSPWGVIDQASSIAEGITTVATASHGGYKLDRIRNSQMPRSARRAGGWFEEDCEYALVLLVFPEIFSDRDLKLAQETAKNYLPSEYTEITGESVRLEDSYCLRMKAFTAENKSHFVVVSAVNSTKTKGMVECLAIRKSDNHRKKVMVTKVNYSSRSEFGYVLVGDEQELPSQE